MTWVAVITSAARARTLSMLHPMCNISVLPNPLFSSELITQSIPRSSPRKNFRRRNLIWPDCTLSNLTLVDTTTAAAAANSKPAGVVVQQPRVSSLTYDPSYRHERHMRLPLGDPVDRDIITPHDVTTPTVLSIVALRARYEY